MEPQSLSSKILHSMSLLNSVMITKKRMHQVGVIVGGGTLQDMLRLGIDVCGNSLLETTGVGCGQSVNFGDRFLEFDVEGEAGDDLGRARGRLRKSSRTIEGEVEDDCERKEEWGGKAGGVE